MIPVDALQVLMDAIRRHYPIAQNAEVTLEANPCNISHTFLKALLKIGINRISIGVQSLDDRELKLLGRLHTSDEAKMAVHMAKKAGFGNISVDLIYGIPERPAKVWERMLCEILKLGVQHVSLYGLTLEENTPLFQRVEQGELNPPDNDTAATEYETASAMLMQKAFRQYEISNWALSGYESRHNTAYWLRMPYIGFGVAAHSFINGKRIANTSILDEYLSCIAQGQQVPQTIETIVPDMAVAESIILGLRLNQGVSADDILTQFGIDLYSSFAHPIEECTSLGLLLRNEDTLCLTPRGRLLSNEVFWRFLP